MDATLLYKQKLYRKLIRIDFPKYCINYAKEESRINYAWLGLHEEQHTR